MIDARLASGHCFVGRDIVRTGDAYAEAEGTCRCIVPQASGDSRAAMSEYC
jgi:hypothetical protein